MDRMKHRWKIVLIALLIILPVMIFFPACGNKDNDDNSSSGSPAGTTYTVHFYTGTENTFNISNQIIKKGGLVRRPDNPYKNGHVFIGWYKDAACTEVWTFEIDTVQEDMTLYAYWQKRQ